MQLTVEYVTGYTEEQIKNFKLPERIAAQDKLTAQNAHIAVLLIDAVNQNNFRVKDALLTIYAIQTEQGNMSYEMQHFRDWLSTLLVK